MAPATTTCSDCGHVFAADELGSAVRICPACGSERASQTLGLLSLTGVGDLSVTAVMTPGDHVRDAKRRLQEARTLMASLAAPLDQPVDTAILRAQRDLHTVLGDIWSLREATIADGVSRATVDAAITASLTMSLAHDLGNLAKHGTLSRDGRSGGRPTFGPPQAESGPVGTSTIFHQTASLDGVEYSAEQIAGDALAEWESHLRTWGLL